MKDDLDRFENLHDEEISPFVIVGTFGLCGLVAWFLQLPLFAVMFIAYSGFIPWLGILISIAWVLYLIIYGYTVFARHRIWLAVMSYLICSIVVYYFIQFIGLPIIFYVVPIAFSTIVLTAGAVIRRYHGFARHIANGTIAVSVVVLAFLVYQAIFETIHEPAAIDVETFEEIQTDPPILYTRTGNLEMGDPESEYEARMIDPDMRANPERRLPQESVRLRAEEVDEYVYLHIENTNIHRVFSYWGMEEYRIELEWQDEEPQSHLYQIAKSELDTNEDGETYLYFYTPDGTPQRVMIFVQADE